MMNTHRTGQKSLQSYRPSKSSQKQSKKANMGKTGYAIEKVTQISSRNIDLKIRNPFLHFESIWIFLSLLEEARTSQ